MNLNLNFKSQPKATINIVKIKQYKTYYRTNYRSYLKQDSEEQRL